MSRLRTELTALRRRIPPAPRIDHGLCELLDYLASRYGGVWEDGRLTAVNFVDGEMYHLDSDGAMTPELARAMLRVAGE